jgi:hypothetical protein
MVFLRSRVLLACAAVSAALLLAALVIIIANAGGLVDPLVLHVGGRGADLFGSVAGLYGLWGLGLAILVVNAFLGVRLYRSIRPLTYVFFGANVFLAVLLLVAIGTIVSLN